MNRILQLLYSILKLVSLPLFNFLLLFSGVKFYGKENWGTFISISIWIYFLAFIAKWSGQNYLIKELSKNTSNYLSIFYSNLIERSTLLLPSLTFFAFFSKAISLYSIILLILIFIYNSFEILVVYKQKLELQFTSEIIGITIILSGFYLIPNFELPSILLLFCFSFLIKNLILFFCIKPNLKNVSLNFSIKNLIKTFPFFLIGFSGWLASKCDIYLVNYFFTKKELSEYQILMNCFIILQSIPAYLVLPINKHLFRLPENSISKIKSKILLFTIPITSIATIIIWIFLKKSLQIEFSKLIYLFAALSTIPTFLYTIDILQFYRKEKEKFVMLYSFISIILNFAIALILIPYLRILGIVISVCISQWLYLFLILRENKNEKHY
ncbi:lipopolysaccharide biosynthesis protein [Flavobacterium terrae]|uniref:Membrane protein involved in the export of O-antigen and teichoic acid n=1 Tax=Flavobacterium terrae TaxID=415425 RepID=A0A1M6BI43_9FLAO|nr:hypothetical protein [Flavobacterium terrae]SHI48153.1 hypothetical protein SAMN05444363_0763 [Flavobacterium terrae]